MSKLKKFFKRFKGRLIFIGLIIFCILFWAYTHNAYRIENLILQKAKEKTDGFVETLIFYQQKHGKENRKSL